MFLLSLITVCVCRAVLNDTLLYFTEKERIETTLYMLHNLEMSCRCQPITPVDCRIYPDAFTIGSILIMFHLSPQSIFYSVIRQEGWLPPIKRASAAKIN